MAAIAVLNTRQSPGTRPKASDTDEATTLKPLDPDVVSPALQAFFIGQNQLGLWVAREAEGRSGGLFLSRRSAIEFANRQSGDGRCALVFPTEPFELDIDNQGHPVVAWVHRWLSSIRRHPTRFAR